MAERSELPPVSIDELLAEPGFTPEDATWRRVTAAGVWLPQQVTVFNRSQDGLAGDNVVTALVQDNGTTVLVNRGFVPLGIDQPPPPSGDVEIIGTVRASQGRRHGELTDERPRPHRGPAGRPRPTRPTVPGHGRSGVSRPDRVRSTDRGRLPGSGSTAGAVGGAAPLLRHAVVHLLRRRGRRLGARGPSVDPVPPNRRSRRKMEQMSRSARHSLHISDEAGSGPASGAQKSSERSGVAAGEATAE